MQTPSNEHFGLAPSDARSNPDAAGFGVYLHWPFCASKCPYCDFNSHVRAGGIDEQRFLKAYLRAIATRAARIGRRRTDSVFIGGGTPSLMAPATVAALLAGIDRHWPLSTTAEITLEANPSSVEAARFSGYRAAGINRVSLGVQALDDDALRMLGRRHSTAEALSALRVARDRFNRVSCDLIYARPGQTPAAWQAELARALALGCDHLSLYQLTIEQGTPFAALHATGKLLIPPAESAEQLFCLTQDMTAGAGLPAYEISNHAAPGQHSRHNLLYWRYGEYVGIGAGAHGRILVEGQRYATAAERSPERWLQGVEATGQGHEAWDLLGAEQVADEALLMGLRLSEGLDIGRLRRLSGLSPSPAAIDRLEAHGLIARVGPQRIAASPAGRLVLNEIVLKLSQSLRRGASAEA